MPKELGSEHREGRSHSSKEEKSSRRRRRSSDNDDEDRSRDRRRQKASRDERKRDKARRSRRSTSTSSSRSNDGGSKRRTSALASKIKTVDMNELLQEGESLMEKQRKPKVQPPPSGSAMSFMGIPGGNQMFPAPPAPAAVPTKVYPLFENPSEVFMGTAPTHPAPFGAVTQPLDGIHSFPHEPSAPHIGAYQPPPPLPAGKTGNAAVDDFVPVIPKSLLQLVLQPESKSMEVGVSGSKIPPDLDRRAREARRAHVSGFPDTVTLPQLREFFEMLLPILRRRKIERELQAMHDADVREGVENPQKREIPSKAVFDIDQVVDLTINRAKTKPFAFLETSLADMIAELVGQCTRNPDSIRLTAPNGESYALMIRRPRDYQPADGVDLSKVVMLGFPRSLKEEKLRSAFEQFGPLESFQVKGGMAYGEFTKIEDARDCVADLYGIVLGNHVVATMPLYDWLRVACIRMGFDVSANPEGAGELGLLGEGEGTKDEPPDHLRDVLELTASLPKAVANLSATYPHLAPLFGSTIPRFPTRILVLLNLFDEEELVLDETYAGLQQAISEEVEQYGRVTELIIPRRVPPPKPPKKAPRPGEGDAGGDEEWMPEDEASFERAKEEFLAARREYDSRLLHPVHGGFGRIFVVYETADEAAHAQQAIAGKQFGGRTVVTSFLFEDILFPPSEKELAEAAEASLELYLTGIGAGSDVELKPENDLNDAVTGEGKKENTEEQNHVSNTIDDCD